MSLLWNKQSVGTKGVGVVDVTGWSGVAVLKSGMSPEHPKWYEPGQFSTSGLHSKVMG